MQLTEDDVLNGQEAYSTFKAVTGSSWAPYATAAVEEQNTQALAVWIRDNLPGGLLAAREFGSWQIALRECLKVGALVKDESWHPNFRTPAQRRSIFKLLYGGLTARQLDAVYHGTSDKLDQLMSEEQLQQLSLVGGTEGFRAEYENSLGGK